MKYIQKKLGIVTDINCNLEKKLLAIELTKVGIRNLLIPPAFEARNRNFCFAHVLEYLKLSYNQRSIGSYCILSGITSIDRFNLHDWGSTPIIFNNNLYFHVETTSELNKEIPTQCLIYGGFAYHGKDNKIINEIKIFFENITISKIRKNIIINYNNIDISRSNMLLANNNNELYPLKDINKYLIKYINASSKEIFDDEKDQIEKIYLNTINRKTPIPDEYNICQREIIKRFNYKKFKY